MLASLLTAFAAAGCSEDAIENVPLVFLSFVQPYPLAGRDCDLQIEVAPVGETPPPPSPPADSCSDRPTTGEAGDTFTTAFDVLPGEWTATVILRNGDCVGSENFVKQEEEAVTVWVELSCK